MFSIKQIISYGIVASSGLLIGFDAGYLNGVLGADDFERRFGVIEGNGRTYVLTSTTRALFTSMLAVGTLLGCILTAFIPLKVGRRGALILAPVIYSLGVALQVAAPGKAAFIIGRVFLGLALGTISIVSPAYLIESSTAKNRGLLICLFEQILTLGNVLACGINLGTEHLHGDKTWRITIAFQLVLAGIIFIGAIFAVESPVVCIKLGREQQARKAVASLHNLHEASAQVKEIYEVLALALEQIEAKGKATLIECFQGTERRRTLIGVAMGWFTIATGINFWFGYGTTFFQAAGVQNAYLVSLGLALVNAAFTALSFFFVDRLGRRATLFFGSAIMGLTQLIAGVIHTVKPNSVADQNCLIVCAVLFIAAYACTWGAVGWVTMSEPFSARARQNQLSVTMFSYWMATWAVGFCTPYLVDGQSSGGAGLGANIAYLWFGLVIITTLWAYLCLPELRRLSFTEVDKLFEDRIPAWRSKEWQATLDNEDESSLQVVREVVVEEAMASEMGETKICEKI